MPKDQGKKELKVTSAEDWGKDPSKQEDGFLLELPSGRVAKVRRTLDLPVLLKSGMIPNPLAGIVRKMMDNRDSNFPVDEMNGEALGQLLDLIHAAIVKMMIEPKVSAPRQRGRDESGFRIQETDEEYMKYLEDWAPTVGTVSIFDIDLPDKLYLYAASQGMAADLATFRGEQNQLVAPVSTGKRVAPKAKQSRKRS